MLKWVARRGRGGGSSFSHTATPGKCLPCGLTVIHLRLCDRKKSLFRGSSLWTLVDKIHIRRESVAVAVVA